MTSKSPPRLSLAASNDEDLPAQASKESSHKVLPSEEPRTPAKSPASSALFFAASDEEDFEDAHIEMHPQVTHKPIVTDNDEVEILDTVPLAVLREDTSRKSTREHFQEPPTKKRRLSFASETHPQAYQFRPTYLGDVLIENAWSTASGKGYVKSGEPVIIQRDEQSMSFSSRSRKRIKETGDKHQVTITSMMKHQKTKKADTVVRILNQRNFEFARLPTEAASWISRLLDFGLVEVRATMTDCPEKLSTGMGLMVTLHIYLLSEAFKPLYVSARQEGSSYSFSGYEAQEESYLRERKASLLKLFDAVGLRPQASASVKTKRFNQKYEDVIDSLAKRKIGKTKMELVGDGEEIEVDTSEELCGNDLNLIYQKAQHRGNAIPMMEPSESFDLTLHGYQKQALYWMFSMEHVQDDAYRTVSMHPLWNQYIFPLEPNSNSGDIDLAADGQAFYFNTYSGEFSLEVPRAEQKCQGGILADGNDVTQIDRILLRTLFGLFTEMGMGKTIMLSALIQSSRLGKGEMNWEETPQTKTRQQRIDRAFRPTKRQSKRFPPSATLIVAPTSLLDQWAEEIRRSSKPGTMQVIVWHRSNRLDLDAVIEDVDEDEVIPKVVITSYGILASEHAKSYKSSVFEIYWLRVILDEAHACKSRTSKTAKAVYDLRARWRWAVTGTPIVNKLEDLFSLLKFLDHKPWSEYAYFRSFIILPFLARDPKAMEIVQVLLESALLRREKNTLDVDGKRIVELPPKEVSIETLEFSSLERKIYDSIWQKVKQNFNQLEAKGLISKNYTHILAMLMRLRRAVLHPNLVLENEETGHLGHLKNKGPNISDLVNKISSGSDDSPSAAFAEVILANLAKEDASECPVCFDIMKIPTIMPECAHQCCKDCILTHIVTCEEKDQQPNCFTCGRGPIRASELLEVVWKEPTDSQPSTRVLLRRNDFQSSTKLEALLRHLRRLKEEDPAFRAVVFSQFTSFMDLIQTVLQRENYDHYRFDGTMDVKKKGSMISAFKALSNDPKVLIISLKAGGVGLNLTTANHVFMMDCWWNAATENQAIDRVHRIGQEKTVYVTHFIVANTIEERILQIQKRKAAIVREAFRESGKDGHTDLQSIKDLKIMFGDD